MDEGIIKFKVEKWIKTSPFDENLWSEIELYRKKLNGITLIGFDKVNKIGYGNVSRRLMSERGKNSFIITGSQTGHLSDLDGQHYSIIKSADFYNNSVICEGPILPSSESISHAACYSFNDDINAVIHIHCQFLWEIFIKKAYLSTPYEAEYGSIELSNSIREIIKSTPLKEPIIIVMKGHKEGIIIVGKSLSEITERLFQLYKSYK
ncbi:MAG: class II aldolase/adducin family protein [Spirochaetes bacterium]|nr:class II aldolase/adducin family protein [Spirochaetota bacterium]